jgi:cellulose synthase/poly-beta-1,6-N-acetylglucosamine synthase-like glycosyltransferase
MITAVALCFYLVIISLMAAQSLFNVRLRLFLWGEPDRARLNQSPADLAEPKTSFTVLLPARHEEVVIADTIEKVCRANYPRELLQVLVICESGDLGTIAKVREKLTDPDTENVRLLVFTDRPINKPHGLNKGLEAATYDVVTIFDAEDEPHENIFHMVNTVMVNEGVDVVQGGVYLMNYDTRWFSALNALEYYFWFKSALHYFGWAGTVPLGGNTVFVKRSTLEQLGGWDEACLTEDADLGIRLSVLGARIRILCDEELVTREETPATVGMLVKQRTRWHQGFFQVLLKGDWRGLPTFTQRALALYILIVPFIQCLFAVMMPISLVMMALVKLPVGLAMFTFLPFYIFGLQASIDIAGLVEFMRAHKREFFWRVLIATMIGYFPYQWLLAVSALRAIMRQLQKRTDWEKTAHIGVHRKARPIGVPQEAQDVA